jgi:NAD(P)-dependent dehydrogenase (short-subunit alcohol dehydrogenase family)
MTELKDYRGRWALVTGAGDGIGRALALAFARQGLNVVASDIRAEAATSVAKEAEALGVQARADATDVADREAMMRSAERLANEGVVPAILWANAGVGAAANTIEASPRTIEWVLSVNIFGVIWTAQAFVPRMLGLHGPRHVGVTASSASIVNVRGPFTLYAASKQGTAGIAEALAAELTPKGIGVTILYPSMLNTNIWNAARARPERFGGERHMAENVGEPWRKTPGPDVVIDPVLRTITKGGGPCVVDATAQSRPLFEEKVTSLRDAFDA